VALDIAHIADLWKQDEPQFAELGRIVSAFIRKEITAFEILPEVSYRTKDLLSIIKKIKKKQREKEYSYSNLNDKLGLRMICAFKEDMQVVDDFLKKYFMIRKAEYKSETLDFDKLDYISNHYDASINPALKHFSKLDHLKDLVFEIQVRTLNQHAWSNTAHSLSYKQEAAISPALKRRIYRLLSFYELADDEFSAVNKALIEHPDNLVYSLLRKLESKIYKFAQVDYDRETSLYAFKTLLSYFGPAQQKVIFSEIESFITKNEAKIQRIFDENRRRFFEIPFLTQPEIFLVWYGLEEYLFSIEDNWENDFDKSELDQIATLWGKTI
jgi:putative GTP pyrophosphokinase